MKTLLNAEINRKRAENLTTKDILNFMIPEENYEGIMKTLPIASDEFYKGHSGKSCKVIPD